MLPYQSLITIDKKSGLTLYRQIAGRLITLIQDGKIAPGSYLPGAREMATIIAVHRNTVVRAYEELVIQGWLQAIPQKGYLVIPELNILKPRTFHPEQHFTHPAFVHQPEYKEIVYDNLAGVNEHAIINLRVDDGFPDVALLPFEEIMKSYRKILHAPQMKNFMTMPYNRGVSQLKESLSNFLNHTRGLNITTDNVLITRGAQQAIYLAATVLLNAGDEVVVTSPNYFMADEIFRQRGAVIHHVAVDQDGMDVDQLEEVLQKSKIKLLYVIPHHHHPTTVTMSAVRRLKLLSLAEKYNLWIIEDDYDYDFHYQNSPILPLASANHGGRIIYIGSFTKMLAPSFRVGYMIAADSILTAVESHRRLMDIRGDSMMEYAISALIDSGEMVRHIKRSRKIYAERCEHAFTEFKSSLTGIADFQKPHGGMAIWLKCRPEFPLEAIFNTTIKHGVQMSGSAYYKGDGSIINGFRFGFASLSKEEISKATSTLAEAAIAANKSI